MSHDRLVLQIIGELSTAGKGDVEEEQGEDARLLDIEVGNDGRSGNPHGDGAPIRVPVASWRCPLNPSVVMTRCRVAMQTLSQWVGL